METGGRERMVTIERVRLAMQHERHLVPPTPASRRVGSRAVGTQMERTDSGGKLLLFPAFGPGSMNSDLPGHIPEAA